MCGMQDRTNGRLRPADHGDLLLASENVCRCGFPCQLADAPSSIQSIFQDLLNMTRLCKRTELPNLGCGIQV